MTAKMASPAHVSVGPKLAATKLSPQAAQDGTTQPSQNGNGAHNSGHPRKRKRSSVDGPLLQSKGDHSSPLASSDKSKSIPMKRACNECRQQKLRCDVTVEPSYQSCTRCRRLNLECRIDANFHRVDKRNRNAEMERELLDLRRRLAEKDSSTHTPVQTQDQWPAQTVAPPADTASSQADALSALHQGAADSLLELRNSSEAPVTGTVPTSFSKTKDLGGTILASEQIDELFRQYFEHYHPFLPVLDPDKPPDHFLELSELLFWTIIAVAARRYADDHTLLMGIASPLQSLLWATIASVTHNYHDVKALCLLCTWPLPTKSTSTDPTFMLSGLMMHIALQCGLHRPSHIKDFSRIRVELRVEEVMDRLKTWASCNIVSQMTSTGFGQPPRSQYDFTLTHHESSSGLPDDLYWRVQIERFCNKISRLVYMNRADPIGLSGDEQRPALISVLSEEYRGLEQHILKRQSPIEDLHLQAAGLHLRLSALFDQPNASNYSHNLLELYGTTTRFLKSALDLDSLRFCGTYFMQMILSAGFCLMKLVNSFFAQHTNVSDARKLFNQTIGAIRSTSINNNDLPGRLAEVLTQLWRYYGAGLRQQPREVDGSLILRVRCRMSMSTVYDSIWRWREQYEFRGDVSTAQLLDTTNPTDPNPTAETESESSLANSGALLSLASNGVQPDSYGGDINFAVFDPLMQILDDSNFAFPYTGVPMNDLGMDNTNFFAQ